MWRLIVERALVVALALLPMSAGAADRLSRWEELVPPGWNPYSALRGLGSAGRIQDGSDRANEMLQRMREVLDEAPIRDELEGRPARLPGYVVPLQTGKAGLSEFLLVPYFGACIHSPPPPANQIIRIQLPKPVKGVRSMDAVWVTGVLKASRVGSAMGASAYRLDDATVEPYNSK